MFIIIIIITIIVIEMDTEGDQLVALFTEARQRVQTDAVRSRQRFDKKWFLTKSHEVNNFQAG
jgi:hypothetical protein